MSAIRVDIFQIYSQSSVPNGFYRAEGTIKNVNTIEDYKALDKAAILNQVGSTVSIDWLGNPYLSTSAYGAKVWEAIKDGSIFSCPSLLASFCMICFADLKKYKFTYLCGFPAIHSESTWQISDVHRETSIQSDGEAANQSFTHRLSAEETASLVESVQTWRYSVDARQHGFFLANRIRREDSAFESLEGTHELQPITPTSPATNLGFRWVIGAIDQYERGFFDAVPSEDCFICFADPSTYLNYPGWVLRNLLVLIRHRWKLSKARILCYRDIRSRRHESRSLVLDIYTDSDTTDEGKATSAGRTASESPKITGWERNLAGKFASKVANLGEYMDPQRYFLLVYHVYVVPTLMPFRLADQAVDLNLKLIKWRISPNLDLETVKNTSCLLLGAGTLGSYVARNLMVSASLL